MSQRTASVSIALIDDLGASWTRTPQTLIALVVVGRNTASNISVKRLTRFSLFGCDLLSKFSLRICIVLLLR